MHRGVTRTFALLIASVLAVALVACGGGDDGGGNAGEGGFWKGAPSKDQKKGGTLRVLSNSDVDHIDPGQAYYQLTYQVTYATQRPLYSYKPEDAANPVPDLAAGPPSVSKDGKTVTIKIRKGVKFSPPVNREVTSKDVKYALTRGFYPSVANGYAQSYLGTLVGAQPVIDGKSKNVPGITTPDPQTIVLKFTDPLAATYAQSLSLPNSAPVPEEYARKFDSQKTSTYGQNQVATGPYMIENDKAGKAIGYQAGKKIILVRNPNWDPKTDFRPAYVDRVDWTIGADPVVAGRQILTGTNLVSGDTPASTTIARAAKTSKSQMALTPLGNRYIAMNTKIPPFNNINVRKAVSAAMDRTRLQLTRGGKIVGDVATHYFAPGAPGFEDAGGTKGPGVDFLAKPEGDMKLAAEYLKKAGFKDGKYSGPPILMVSENEDPASKTGQVTLDQFRKLGFKVNYRTVSHDAMYTNFCNVPKRKVHVCPNVGWLPDFNDGYAWFWATFNGKSIVPVNNSNWPQLDDPKIDAAMQKAAETADPKERAKAWGEVDKMVTESAAAIPWFWDRVANIRSKNVHGVVAKWNAAWDLAYTSVGTKSET
jgi:peptide/nickel transport system substrate-binding protein